MRRILKKDLSDAVSSLCAKANFHLRKDIEAALIRAIEDERSLQAKTLLRQLLENAKVAREECIALCQDTGMPVVFVDIGRDIDCSGVDMVGAVNLGVEKGYRRGFLRDSIVSDPLRRTGQTKASPCVIHFNFTRRKDLKITVFPKGFGCENKTKLAMFNPTASIQEIRDFIVSVVREAGPDACPPYILGVGIGGTADYACQLSKEALLRPINKRNALSHVAALENGLLKDINALNIGPMGLGGKTTCLGVNIETFATHIAGLPVCVNLSCHVLRSASVIL